MAKVELFGMNRFRVVHSITNVPVGFPNIFPTRAKAKTRAKEVRCNVLKICP